MMKQRIHFHEMCQNPNWKGGRYREKDGYIRVKVSPKDFFYPMANARGYIREHRLVMAKSLKRCLLPWEVVHHKNGNKQDNRINNLRLLSAQICHIPSIRWQAELNKRDKRIERLEHRVTLLEAENVLLENRGISYDTYKSKIL